MFHHQQDRRATRVVDDDDRVVLTRQQWLHPGHGLPRIDVEIAAASFQDRAGLSISMRQDSMGTRGMIECAALNG
jgi:hypothetical protein